MSLHQSPQSGRLGHAAVTGLGMPDVGALENLSRTFDAEWYLARYPDAAAHRSPVQHYDQIGWRRGYDPNPFFSTRNYLAANADVECAGMNPFLHYVLYGKRSRR